MVRDIVEREGIVYKRFQVEYHEYLSWPGAKESSRGKFFVLRAIVKRI